jgi:hypothetical protein
VVAGQSCGKAFEDLAQLIRLADAADIQFVHEDAEAVDGLDEAKPLQFEKRLTHCALGYAKLASETLLTKALSWLALSGKNSALDLFSDIVSCHPGLCRVSRHLFHLGNVAV